MSETMWLKGYDSKLPDRGGEVSVNLLENPDNETHKYIILHLIHTPDRGCLDQRYWFLDLETAEKAFSALVMFYKLALEQENQNE